MNRCTLAPLLCLIFACSSYAEEGSDDVLDSDPTVKKETLNDSPDETDERRHDEAALDEDPEAQRRSKARIAAENAAQAAAAGLAPAPDEGKKRSLELYSSIRVHAINTFDVNGNRTDKVSDGNSRLGMRGDWQYRPGWWVMGRFEAGFDLVDQFSTRGSLFGEGGMTERLMFAGFQSDKLTLVYGRNWSPYYKVAGMTDRFAIFGGSASGAYNAGTTGNATGTGRADDVFQARVYIDKKEWGAVLKPFNLNLQYQLDQGIPGVANERYAYGYSASAILETQKEFSLGLAYNRSHVQDPQHPAIAAAGIDGDATAFAISSRVYGDRWYASVLYSRLNNMELTDRGQYYDAQGLEVYAQWEVKDNWWLIGGGNWLEPQSDDPEAGLIRVKYYVLGGRYSFDSFNRMVYVEYRIDKSRLFDGTPGKDEFTFGVRWDFGH
jgi:predicted porin